MPRARRRSLEVAPRDGAAPRVRWAGRSRWLEVSIGLVGEEGAMHALTPTIFVPLQALRPAPGHIACVTPKQDLLHLLQTPTIFVPQQTPRPSHDTCLWNAQTGPAVCGAAQGGCWCIPRTSPCCRDGQGWWRAGAHPCPRPACTDLEVRAGFCSSPSGDAGWDAGRIPGQKQHHAVAHAKLQLEPSHVASIHHIRRCVWRLFQTQPATAVPARVWLGRQEQPVPHEAGRGLLTAPQPKFDPNKRSLRP